MRGFVTLCVLKTLGDAA